jgi:hypothetical protein
VFVRAAHDRTTDGSVPMEVEADEVGLEEHEEVVLEPRNTMSVHHRIYLPSLVHGHHGGCGGRASRGGPIAVARHRAEPHHHRLWLGVGRAAGGGVCGRRTMISARRFRGEKEPRGVSWGRRLRAAHDDFSATVSGRERTSGSQGCWIGSGAGVLCRIGRLRSYNGRMDG